jgi:hypothetical protein
VSARPGPRDRRRARAINQRAPVEQRGETASSFFVVMYVGLSRARDRRRRRRERWSLAAPESPSAPPSLRSVLTVLVSLSRSDE